MSVDSFDPAQLSNSVSPDGLALLLAASVQLEDEQFGLDEVTAKRLSVHARQGTTDWAEVGKELTDEQLVALAKLFTLAEARLPGWDAGAKSPVVPLVRLLKSRNAYPNELGAWIKANTENRFLPHGSLMDRL